MEESQEIQEILDFSCLFVCLGRLKGRVGKG